MSSDATKGAVPSPPSPRRSTRGGSLVWRLYALGLVQLVLLAATVWAVGRYVMPQPKPALFPLASQLVAQRFPPIMGKPDVVAQELARVKRENRLDAAIYDELGSLVASNAEGKRPPPPIPETQMTTVGSEWTRATPFTSGDMSYVLVTRFGGPSAFPVGPLETMFLAGIFIVGLGASLTARWIGRPLTQLSEAARALGSGNLNARADVRRRDELGEVGRAFDEMAERVRRLLLTEKELLANVSHELRTPLARIRVALELGGEGDAQRAQETLQEIHVDLAELETLVDDILTTARFELAEGHARRTTLALQLEDVPARTVAEAAAERFSTRHRERPLAVRLDEGLPNVSVDPALFRRALDNLLENAHKYSPDGKTDIALRARAEGRQVYFEVEDHGIGIAGDDVPHVFDAFFRSDRSRCRGTGGVGLGLTLAKRIVEAHRGTIQVESAVGTGTVMRVSLPRG